MDKSKQISHTFMPWAYDTRVIQRNVNEGVLTQADVKNMLEKLPDVAEKAEPMHTTLGGNDIDDDMEEQD